MKLYKNIKPIYLYFFSVIALVLSNFFREENQILYVFLLTSGTLLFIFGFMKARNDRK